MYIQYTYTNFELSQSRFPCLQDDKESGNFKIFVYPVFLYYYYWGQSINAKNVYAQPIFGQFLSLQTKYLYGNTKCSFVTRQSHNLVENASNSSNIL